LILDRCALRKETVSIEETTTPTGNFHAFKITVTVNGTLFEAMWFGTDLGQVVYGEFYNNKENVTQTLIAYKLKSEAISTIKNFSTILMSVTCLSQGKPPVENFRKLYLARNSQFRYGVEDIL
jgi:hypothetical protein